MMAPLYHCGDFLLPDYVKPTTEQLGRAMIAVAKNGAAKRVLKTSGYSWDCVEGKDNAQTQ